MCIICNVEIVGDKYLLHRNKLESDVKKQGGKVLNEIPKDDHVYDEHLVLISQPKDFRKLKYLFALLVGKCILIISNYHHFY